MIVIVRHGNTEYNTAKVFQPHDTPLSELGFKQAKACGDRLKELKIVKVLTSDLTRTKQTTESILSSRDDTVTIIESELLREREFGDLKGTSYEHNAHTLFHPHSDYEPPNGESWKTFHERVKNAWDMVLGHAKKSIKSKDDVILVVTHGLVKGSLAHKIFGQEARGFENTSVTIVSVEQPHKIFEINSTTHLESISSKL